MKEKGLEISVTNPITMVIPMERVQIMQEVADGYGVTVERLGNPGERTTLRSGLQIRLAKDSAYVALFGGDPKTGLKDFWAKVDEVAAERQNQQQ